MLKMRGAREQDLEGLLDIINQPSVIRYMRLQKPVKMQRVRKWFSSFERFGQPAIFVMELDAVIGVFSMYADGKTTIWIGEGHQRKGHGTKAMQWLADYARGKGLPRLWLECLDENEPALNFYQKLGFSEIGRKEDSIIMELRLADKNKIGA